MKDREKQIEEISDLISNYYHNGSFVCKGSLSEMIYDKLFPKNSVVLSKEEYNELKQEWTRRMSTNKRNHYLEKRVSKETAEKIIYDFDKNTDGRYRDYVWFQKLAKQFGVEIKE